MRNVRIAMICLAVGALTACGRAEAPAEPPAPAIDPDAPEALSGYSHRIETDISGYFAPVSEVRLGQRRLVHLFLGHERAFRAWENGARSGAAPVTLIFDDGSRLRPESYSVTDGAVRVFGRHPQLGPISFEGDLDAGALAQSQRSLGGDGARVLTGTLRVAGRTFENQSFSWRSGDDG